MIRRTISAYETLFARRECKYERARLERLQAPSLLLVVVVVVLLF